MLSTACGPSMPSPCSVLPSLVASSETTLSDCSSRTWSTVSGRKALGSGVVVDGPGEYRVTFRYWPGHFSRNLTLAGLGAVLDEGLDVAALAGVSDAQVHAALTAIAGIGPWTADIFIMFCLGRADAFAAGDLALQVAAQHAAGLDARPLPAELTEMAEQWRPWRGVAARMLWAYYPHMKKVGSGLPV